jgi:hypothetical protein
MFWLLTGAVGPFLVYLPSAGTKVFHLFQYHGQRGLQIESIWASIPMMGWKFGFGGRIVPKFGSYETESRWSEALLQTSKVAILATAVGLGLWAIRRGKRSDRRLALDTAILVVIDATILSKVFSPQYLLWFVPLAMLLALNLFSDKRVLWCRFAALVIPILGITDWLFPTHYGAFLSLADLALALIVIRCLLLVALLPLFNGAFFAKYGFRARPLAESPA